MRIYFYLICGCICLMFSCKKGDTGSSPTSPSSPSNPDQFSVSLTAVNNTNVTDFTLQGSLQVTQLSQAAEYGFIFSSYTDPSLYQGKVIGIGKSQKSVNYSYLLTGLDTGKTYYCCAYVLINGKVTYSPVITVGKVVPLILNLTLGDTSSNPTTITIATNFKRLVPSDKISIYLGTQLLKIIATDTSAAGAKFIANYPGVLAPGVYTFKVNLNNVSASYTKTLISPPGIWTNVGAITFSQLLTSNKYFGFVDAGWVYFYELIVPTDPNKTVTAFIKQNIQTGEVITLHTFDKDTYIYGQAIVFDGNLVHFIGGEEYDLHTIACVNSHYVYNTVTDKWTKQTDFPGSIRRSAASVLYNNKIYYGMGYRIPDYNNTNSAEVDRNDMWVYDLQTNVWQQLPGVFPQDGRSHNASFAIGSKIYIVAGYDRVMQENSTWCYDAAVNTWTQKANYPGAGFEDPGSFQLGQYGYVGLGTDGPYNSDTGPVVSQNFFRYDPVNDNWTQLPDLTYAIQYPTCGVSGKYGIITGIFSEYGTNSIYSYTP